MPDGLREMASVLGVQSRRQRELSPIELIAIISRGLPVAALDRVARFVAPTDSNFKYRIVSKATLARRKHRESRLSSDESDRLARLAKIWALADDVWGGSDAAREFLFRAHALLDGRLPIDVVLESEIGAQLVDGILGRLKYGTAA